MHENKHALPPEIDRAYEIKQRIMQAEKRKSVYEQTKKGIDNDNFINHMQTLRRSSKNHRKTLDTRYAIFTYLKSYSNSNKKMFRTMVNASGEIGVEPVPDLNVPQPLNLQPIYHNNPASPSSELPHFYITPREWDTSSSVQSVEEMYQHYKHQQKMQKKSNSKHSDSCKPQPLLPHKIFNNFTSL